MLELLRDIFSMLAARRKLVLVPVVVISLLFGLLLVLANGSALSPFLYALF